MMVPYVKLRQYGEVQRQRDMVGTVFMLSVVLLGVVFVVSEDQGTHQTIVERHGDRDLRDEGVV